VIQLHKHGRSAAAFTNGHDYSSSVRWMVDALARLKGARSLIIDGELVACDAASLPDFYGLHFHYARRSVARNEARTMSEKQSDRARGEPSPTGKTKQRR
jgi:ATP-dependent DNA ligase